MKRKHDGSLSAPSEVGGLVLIYVQDYTLFNSSTDLKFLAHTLCQLENMGVRPLVVLEPCRNSQQELLRFSRRNHSSSLWNHASNHITSLQNHPTEYPQNQKLLSLKWSQINCAFQLAEQIDQSDGTVRGIPIYSNYAQGSFSSYSLDEKEKEDFEGSTIKLDQFASRKSIDKSKTSNRTLELSNRTLESSNRTLESSNRTLESSNRMLESSNRMLESSNIKIDLSQIKLHLSSKTKGTFLSNSLHRWRNTYSCPFLPGCH